ncbi:MULTISPECIES: dihydrolipoyl dehydrogenase family protein [Furfurilactobacillus]|uniref:NAD(P)/FAD-dependent oxidoreductase n=1 Tax=Furfurilactobacillus rossiae TaxID=231049 RepID=A0A7C9N8A8_9LACO|nr:NAD(P)/FAD-dependent oxidoreductase [Furfurilactobacillus milii]MYV06152.1 NAD(P)/FAD-dependent oxidoreductase [Furfurilactobacillus milii]
MTHVETLIIGGGPGGLALAYALKGAGQTVAVAEENLWGGTCPNRGCDPKKILLAAVEAKRSAEHMDGQGLNGEPTINWSDLMRNKFAYTDSIPGGTLSGLKQAAITTFTGHAQFAADGHVMVGSEEVVADKVVLATGERPRRLDIPGAKYVGTSTDFLNMRELPRRLTFIGGGYIAFELADIANAAGADVSLVLHNDKPLRAFPADLVADLVAQLKAEGVHIYENVDVAQVDKTEDGLALTDGHDFQLTTDAVIGATGRIANVDTLNLAAVGVEADAHGVQVNDHLQTTNPNIYALGDVVAKRTVPKLTPVAGYDARYLAGQLTGQQVDAPISYPAIPTLVFGMPKLAKVGVDVTAATKEASLTVKKIDMTHWYTYNRIHDSVAKVTVVLNDKQQLVGATVLSSIADEMINYLTFLINQHATAGDFENQVMAYPSPASDIDYLL